MKRFALAGIPRWVTVHNSSGRDYQNATLTLIAGELRRVTPPPIAPIPPAVPLAAQEKQDIETKPAFEYAERVLTDRQVVGRDELGREIYRDTYEIALRNQKDFDAVIEVKEHLQGIWKIVFAEPNYEKLDASTVLFTVAVKAHDVAKTTYTVEWKY